MLSRYYLPLIFLIAVVVGADSFARAQGDPIEHTWFNKDKTAQISIYKARDGKFYGKIVWLREPNRDGKPKVDFRNPNEARQNDPLIGLLILKGFKKDGDVSYEDGTIYDPKNGKTYSCRMNREGEKLNVRGYIGFSFIGPHRDLGTRR